MGEAVHVNALTVHYDQDPVLKGVSLSINEGEFVSILGPNGSGKTTLIKALTGLIHDIQGEIRLFGKPIRSYRRKDFARHVSFLPQDPPTTIPFLVHDIVMMGRFPYIKRFVTGRTEDREAVQRAMNLMRIDHLGKRHLMELSGGEVRRVFIAQAVAQESSVLFLDEPTANLDINYQVEIFRILEKFNREMNKTIVLITHDINHAARFTERVILLKEGEIFAQGEPVKIISTENMKTVFSTDVSNEYDSNKRPYILI